MATIANCGRCGVGLERISYIEPDWTSRAPEVTRNPLCKPCWEEAYAEAKEIYQKGQVP